MSWGKWIIISFALFAIFISILAAICMRQDISLVSKTYYEDELKYEDQIQCINRTSQLKAKPKISFSEDRLEIHFNSYDHIERGEVKLFRPSDIGLDKEFTFQPASNTEQKFDLTLLPKGMYKAKVSWKMNGEEYYLEKIINL